MREPLVFLPGMMCDARLFAPQIMAFSQERPVMFIPLTGEATILGMARRVLEQAPPASRLPACPWAGSWRWR